MLYVIFFCYICAVLHSKPCRCGLTGAKNMITYIGFPIAKKFTNFLRTGNAAGLTTEQRKQVLEFRFRCYELYGADNWHPQQHLTPVMRRDRVTGELTECFILSISLRKPIRRHKAKPTEPEYTGE